MSQTPVTRRQLRERDNPVASPSSTASTGTTGSTSPGMVSGGSSSSVVKMRTRLSTGTLIMNGTSTIKEKAIRPTPLDSDTSKAQKDTSIIGSKRRAGPSEVLSPVLPKQRKTTKSDGTQNDPYCWLCHKEDCNVNCLLCPRGYHARCLMLASLPKDWVCGECEKIMEAGCMDTCSKAMKQISTDTLSLLLRYALDRMRQPGSEVFQKPVNVGDLPFYSDVVVNPMDLSMLEKNIKKKEYGCTEAFLADAKWILHNCIIYNGLHHKLTVIARNIVKSCKHEMAEIEVCPQCYKHSCMKGEANWFIEPCDPPHPLVWAKLKGYPFWPAKAMEEVGGSVDVRFFGAHDKSVVPVSHVFMLSKDPPTVMKNKKGGFSEALDEVKKHIEIIREKYGSFDYAPFRTPYDRGDVYMNNKLKGVNMMAARRFKVAAHGRFATKGKEAEKVSATFKTASAVKSKYSSLASKKSTTSATTSKPEDATTSKPEEADRQQHITHVPQSPDTAEKAIKKALSDCGRTSLSKSRFINPTVSVMDVIQQKLRNKPEMEEKKTSKATEDHKPVDSGRDEVMNEKQAEKEDLSSGSGLDKVSKEKAAEDNTAEKNNGEKDAGMKETSSPRTTEAEAVTQPEKETIPQAGLEMASEDKAAGNTGRKTEAENDRDHQVSNEKDRLTIEGEKNAENEKRIPEEEMKEDDTEKKIPGEETKEDDCLTSLTNKHQEQSSTTTESETGKCTEDNVKKPVKETVQSVEEMSENSDTVSSRMAKSAKNTEESSDKSGNNSELAQDTVKEVASAEKEMSKNSTDASTGQEAVATLSTSLSPKTGAELAMKNVSPQSGVEYQDSLRKTIEACKGKLGITDVEEVQEPMDVSDDEESLHSRDDQGGDGNTEATTESQFSTDSQDSRISLEMEVDSASCSSKADMKSDSDMVLEKKAETDTDSENVLSTSSSEKKLDDDVSGVALAQNTSTAEKQEKSGKNPVTAVSLMSENVAPNLPSDLTLDSDETRGTKLTCGLSETVVQKKSSCASSEPAIERLKMSEVCSVKTTSLSSSQSKCAPSTVAKSLNPAVVREIAKASSVLAKAAENRTRRASQEERQETGRLKQSRMKAAFHTTSLLRTNLSTAVPCASVTEPNSTREITAVSNVVSSEFDSKSDTEKSKTWKGTSSNGKKVSPITIEDDDEPSLLMEVESEVERDEPLVIDLDEEDLDSGDNGTVVPRKSDLSKERPSSPTTLKSISEPKIVKPKKSAQGLMKEKLKAQSSVGSIPYSVPPSTLSSSSSSSVLSEPCQMMISDVRSLSGTVHDWKEDSNKQSSPRQQAQQLLEPLRQGPPQQQLQQQLQQQAVQQPLQHAEQPVISQPQTQPLPAGVTMAPTQYHTPQNFRMPPTPPVEHLQGHSINSTTKVTPTVETAPSSSSNDTSVSSDKPSADQRSPEQSQPTLTPAAVRLINKYSQQIMGNTQLQLAEMSKELLSTSVRESESLVEERLNEEKEKNRWTLNELQHNHKMTVAEMKACFEAEKAKALFDLRTKMTEELREAVAETKKKQWCAECWKEALYYCCWNTSYCSYACQQRHWSVHQHHCRQVVDATTDTSTTAATMLGANPTVLSIRTSSGDQKVLVTGDASDRLQTQKFKTPTANARIVNIVQGMPIPSQAVKLHPTPTQPLQQFQYIQPGTPTNFQTGSQTNSENIFYSNVIGKSGGLGKRIYRYKY